MSEELKLTHEEQVRITDLIHAEEMVFNPQVMPPLNVQQALADLKLTIKALGWTIRMSRQLRPVLARQLRMAQQTRCYTEWGYKNFDEFLEVAVEPFVASRSVLYEIMAIADKAPSITPVEYANVPITNFKKLIGYTNDRAANFQEELRKASVMSIREFNSYAEEKKFITKGEQVPVAITILATAEIAHMWKKLRTAEQTINACESTNEAVIFMHVMDEFAGEYGVDLS